jgi:hypothetical protein
MSQLASLPLVDLLDSVDLQVSADRLVSQVAEALQALVADRGERSSRLTSKSEEYENYHRRPVDRRKIDINRTACACGNRKGGVKKSHRKVGS